ncbi:MAG: TonB-dependent receptor [Pyrinomonadaceae bacterium]|nr:TonB-dependent receptor [Pyrinomonadaceae bacterium]
MKPNTLQAMIIGSVLMIVIASSTNAQTATATLKGSVIDSNERVVAGATVTLIQTATGLKRTFTTDERGQYSFTLIEPGLYALEIQARDFKSQQQPSIRLEVGQTAEVNVELSPGDIRETVNISGFDLPLLNSTTSSLGGVIDRDRVDALPLNGRSVLQLAQLEPGVNVSASARGANPDLTATGEVSINGGRTSFNEVLADGLTLTNKGDNRVALKPSADAVQEFRILTNAYAAEYGRTGGGAINISTRSGGTEFHGTAWEYVRNDALDARSFFVNASPAGVKEKLRFNQFGGNIGGPAYLPRFGEGSPSARRSDKLFFFFNFEALKISQTLQRQSTVPTALMRNGDFSALLGSVIPGVTVRDTNGNLISARIGQIYVPGAVVPANQPGAGSRIAFANNVIPTSMINPVAKAALSYYPLPNASGTNNYIANSILTTDNRQYTGRIDYNISSTRQFFLRFIKDDNTLFNSGPFPGSIASPQPNPSQTSVPGSVVVNYVDTLSPRFVLHLNAGGTRFNNVSQYFSEGFDPTSLGFPSYLAAASGDTGVFPTFQPTGYTSLGPLRNFGNFKNNQDSFSFNQDLSWLRSSHSLKFGANERVYRAYNYRPDDPAGNFTFTRAFTARTPTESTQQSGDAIASFLLGNPASGRLGIAPQLAIQNKYYAFYVQDDWTVSRRLTLNLGLRWEADLPNTERFDRLTNFDPAAMFPVNQITVNFPATTNLGTRTIPLFGVVTAAGRGTGTSRENYDRDLNNWSPRLGFAFKLNEKTVLRGGAGGFYAPLSGGGLNAVTYALADLAETGFIASIDGNVTPTPGTNLSNPFPQGIVQPAGRYLGPLTSYGQLTTPVRLRNTRQPLIWQWNLNVQRELPAHLLVDVAYSGSAGIGLLSGATDLNQLSNEALAIAATTVNGQPLGNVSVANPFLTLPVDQRPPAGSILARSTVTVAQLLRPHPQFGNIVAYGQNEAHSTYHSAQIKVSRRFNDGLVFTGAYTFSKLLDDLTGISVNVTFQAQNYQNYYNRRADKALSNFDVKHRFVGNLSWALPFGSGHRYVRSGLAAKVLGGFTFNSIIQAQSGFPLSISATNPSLQGLGFIHLRPNLVGDPVRSGVSEGDLLAQYFNRSAFAQPAPFTLGNAPRTLSNVRAPVYFATNLSLVRDFKFTEKARLQLRAEVFNAFNHPNFTNPVTTLGAANFGGISATEDPRQIQLAVRVYF